MARAPSVPGLGAMCQSASLAVLERYESITTTLAPFLLASFTIAQWCKFVLTLLHAQITIYLLCT